MSYNIFLLWLFVCALTGNTNGEMTFDLLFVEVGLVLSKSRPLVFMPSVFYRHAGSGEDRILRRDRIF